MIWRADTVDTCGTPDSLALGSWHLKPNVNVVVFVAPKLGCARSTTSVFYFTAQCTSVPVPPSRTARRAESSIEYVIKGFVKHENICVSVKGRPEYKILLSSFDTQERQGHLSCDECVILCSAYTTKLWNCDMKWVIKWAPNTALSASAGPHWNNLWQQVPRDNVPIPGMYAARVT